MLLLLTLLLLLLLLFSLLLLLMLFLLLLLLLLVFLFLFLLLLVLLSQLLWARLNRIECSKKLFLDIGKFRSFCNKSFKAWQHEVDYFLLAPDVWAEKHSSECHFCYRRNQPAKTFSNSFLIIQNLLTVYLPRVDVSLSPTQCLRPLGYWATNLFRCLQELQIAVTSTTSISSSQLCKKHSFVQEQSLCHSGKSHGASFVCKMTILWQWKASCSGFCELFCPLNIFRS